MSGNLADFADYTAQVAGRIPGVLSVYGAGTNRYDDPLRPGFKIQPAPDNPVDGKMEHWSELPQAPSGLPTATQDGAVGEVNILVSMRLFVPRGNLATVRQILNPMADLYVTAFGADSRLGGLCLTSNFVYIAVETPTADDAGQHAWLHLRLACLVLYSP